MEKGKSHFADTNIHRVSTTGLDKLFTAAKAEALPQQTLQDAKETVVLEAADMLNYFWADADKKTPDSSECTTDSAGISFVDGELFDPSMSSPFFNNKDQSSFAPSQTAATQIRHNAGSSPLPERELVENDFEDSQQVPTHISILEAAEMLGIDRPAILRLIKSGKLPAIQNDRGHWSVSNEAIREIMKAHGLAENEDAEEQIIINISPEADQTVNDFRYSVSPDVQAFMGKLRETHSQLQAANYRIGYLECEIQEYQLKVKLLPDMEARASKLSQVEMENRELKAKIPEIECLAQRLPVLEQENAELRSLLLHRRTRGGFLKRIWSTIFGGASVHPDFQDTMAANRDVYRKFWDRV